MAARIERQLGVADYLRNRLTGTGWTLVNDSPLPLACITHDDTSTADVDVLCEELRLALDSR